MLRKANGTSLISTETEIDFQLSLMPVILVLIMANKVLLHNTIFNTLLF